MQTEEFYKQIQQKISKSDFELESSFPTWNKDDVWQRIEVKQGKRKKTFYWKLSVAASVLFMLSLGLYFNLKNNAQLADSQIVKTNVSTQKNLSIFTKPTQSTGQNIIIEKKLPFRGGRVSKSKPIETILETPATALVEPQKNEEKAPIAEQTAIAFKQETTIIDESSKAEKTLQSNTFIANPNLIAVKVPSKKERIAILEIPDDDEQYNIQKRENKKGFLSRLNKKSNKNDELPSINNKPNKVWAFVKESLKNETITTDTTNK